MTSLIDSATDSLGRVTDLRHLFVMRAESLLADLAFVGLVADLLDSASVALHPCRNDWPTHVAFPLVRRVFEAGQHIIAVATATDFLSTGTRPWLYHQRMAMRVVKKAAGNERAREWLESNTEELVRIWRQYNPDADALISAETGRLDSFTDRKNRRADNFMNERLDLVVERGYERLVRAGVDRLSLRVENGGIYAALSLESHASMRVTPAMLTVSPGGAVTLLPRPVDEDTRRASLLGCLDSSLNEAAAALTYVIDMRRRHHIQRTQEAAE